MKSERWELEPLREGDVTVLRVRGHIEVEAAGQLLDLATSIAANSRSVQIDLDGVDSLSEDAAALLLFRQAPWHRLPEGITLRAGGRSSRHAVLRAYARRRTRATPNP